MATFSIKLTDINVKAWFPPDEPLEEELIKNGNGTYTISIFGARIAYYLEVDTGTRVNPLRLGQPVQATGKDFEGKPVSTVVLETTGTGTPAHFKGPYKTPVPPPIVVLYAATLQQATQSGDLAQMKDLASQADATLSQHAAIQSSLAQLKAEIAKLGG